MAENRPIGVLDSGVGGLSVLKEIKKILPNESIIYFADSKNCPYGTKSLVEIRKITKRVVDFLIAKNCKLIVVACNSITSVLIEELRREYKVPFVGIEPATLVAAKETKKGKIGVLATKTTAESKLFKETKNKVSSKIDVEVEIGRGLVELVEEGELNSEKARNIVFENLKKFRSRDVDQVVLGCTHYPFLIDLMREFAPEMNFVDPALGVAKQTKKYLEKNNLENNKKNISFLEVYFSKKVAGMETLLSKFEFKNMREKRCVKI